MRTQVQILSTQAKRPAQPCTPVTTHWVVMTTGLLGLTELPALQKSLSEHPGSVRDAIPRGQVRKWWKGTPDVLWILHGPAKTRADNGKPPFLVFVLYYILKQDLTAWKARTLVFRHSPQGHTNSRPRGCMQVVTLQLTSGRF
jgi:hypothetical protein